MYGNKGSTDQHAYVQQLRDGVNNFFATFIEVRECSADAVEVEAGATCGDFLQGFLRGTRQALAESGRSSITISIPEVNAKTLGMLIALFERAVSFYASLVNINAYHQPGVEAGKKAAGTFLALLGKVRAALGSTPETAAQVAARLDADQEAVYHCLVHIASSDSSVKWVQAACADEDTFPGRATFRPWSTKTPHEFATHRKTQLPPQLGKAHAGRRRARTAARLTHHRLGTTRGGTLGTAFRRDRNTAFLRLDPGLCLRSRGPLFGCAQLCRTLRRQQTRSLARCRRPRPLHQRLDHARQTLLIVTQRRHLALLRFQALRQRSHRVLALHQAQLELRTLSALIGLQRSHAITPARNFLRTLFGFTQRGAHALDQAQARTTELLKVVDIACDLVRVACRQQRRDAIGGAMDVVPTQPLRQLIAARCNPRLRLTLLALQPGQLRLSLGTLALQLHHAPPHPRHFALGRGKYLLRIGAISLCP